MTITFRKGFTLIELMVVIAVIGILAAVALVSLTGLQKSARDATRKSNISDYSTALGRYYQDNSKYPAVATANTFDTDSGAGTGLFGASSSLVPTYVAKVLRDPSTGNSQCGNAGTLACTYNYYSDGAGNYEVYATLEAPPSSGQYFYINSNGIRGNTNTACSTTFGTGGTACQ